MIWVLLVIYQLKHWVCDYPLQGRFMLGKFKPYPEYILPLLAHAGVHAVATFAIALCFKSLFVAGLLGLMDGAIHFVVDRVKASPELGGRFKAITKKDFEEHVKSITAFKKWANELPEDHAEKQIFMKEIPQREADWEATLKSNTYFWWALGADQLAHHLTHYALIALILM